MRLVLLFLFSFSFTVQASQTIVTVNTVLGSFEIEMLDDDAPLNVANFLGYVQRGDYDNTFIHRSIPGFIVQGGGYKFDAATNDAPHIVTDGTVVNEFKVSNTRGTVAMAKLGNDPDSATSEWFVNLANNAGNLDNQNGGFTVFGRVLGDGMDIVDAIAGLPINNFQGAFTNTPTVNFTGVINDDIFVKLSSVTLRTVIDTDNDGTEDSIDTDDDNDNVPDVDDAFPLDASETLDTDDDGTGNNADTDDDNDGILDISDAFPLDATNNPLLVNRLQNIATRGFVGTGDNVLIGGLIIGGTEPKTVIIRAKGPSLAEAGVSNTLPNPKVVLFSGSVVIDENDDWQEHANMNLIPENLQPSNVQESVIFRTLEPGAYTAIVLGVNDEEGIGLVEVFELDDTGVNRLENIATRGLVGTGDNVLIGGLVISGTQNKKVVIRAKGPSLESAGVAAFLGDPEMIVLSGSTVIASNNNWRDDVQKDQIPLSLQPSEDLEAALFTELAPGAYTVIVSGVGGTTGIGIFEVFEIQ
ncbi:MAG: cyclophilin family peptidyl-prolyl cis-trans isomerase [Candidatus Azotimanducaceae bacterium]|jgi:cyclophilin family peptidyl-prolyl cis-trans isomerase